MSKGSVCVDGPRYDLWTNDVIYRLKGDSEPEHRNSIRNLYTPERCFAHNKEENYLVIPTVTPDDPEAHYGRYIGMPSAYGYVGSHVEPVLPDLMRNAPSLTVRPAMELVGGHETYVVESMGPYGKHTGMA